MFFGHEVPAQLAHGGLWRRSLTTDAKCSHMLNVDTQGLSFSLQTLRPRSAFHAIYLGNMGKACFFWNKVVYHQNQIDGCGLAGWGPALLQLRIYTDVLNRDRRDLPRHAACYDIGFPCQPFSLLHNNSALFGEEPAEVFREAVKTVYVCSPLVCIFENVIGLLRVWGVVVRYLEKLTGYYFAKLLVDPKKLGDCVQRRRVYIVLIHKSLGPQVTCFVYKYVVCLQSMLCQKINIKYYISQNAQWCAV